MNVSFNQGIYPFVNASGVLSFDYKADAYIGFPHPATITLIGYIS